ncbi:SPOR domain-containing protein [Tenacibaculum sp. IB213877]|uniref:SPOR domain-containing protein n=1 Tax=Tenacibaculum sp. IB213877 TaxID=3097351 RepID=UPI002A59E6FA|nr:SPOR domain-containing protein [Tenacibaculum sp. IB213877]MDY0780853.1 SPOR domain-containing protein [Tenacibaculum sp. IB213877]
MKINKVILTFFVASVMGILTLNAQSSYTDNKNINSLLEKKREYNKYNGSGFRIQLYNGNETRAKSLKSSFERDFPGVYTKLKYEQPDWKVQVGSYKTKLDADRALNKVREKYSGAFILPL